MSTKDQWDLLRGGDQSALASIYQDTIDNLIDYGCRFAKDKQLVEDAIHDTFISIWKNRSTISTTTNPLAYLMLSLKRNIFRKVNKLKIVDGESEITELNFQAELTVEESMIRNEEENSNSKRLKEAYSGLSKRQKEAIYLKFYQNKSYEEVSDLLEMNYQSTRNLIFRAITSLRKTMSFLIILIWI